MTFKTHTGRLLSFAALAATLAAAAAGCGGGSTNGDAIGSTPSAYPYLYAYQDNATVAATGIVASGLDMGSATDPATGDVFLFTFASSNSAPNNTLSGSAYPYQLGLADGQFVPTGATTGGTFTAGNVIPAAAPGGVYLFRAQGVQGQVSHTVENITAATITPPGGTAEPFGFALPAANSATPPAGPFQLSGYVASVTIPASLASGVYPFSTTISDAAGHSTTTVFQSVILKPTDAAIASSNPIALKGATPSVTYGPDAGGTTVLIVPASKTAYTVNVTTTATNAAGTSTTTTNPVSVVLAGGTVTCE